MDGERNRKEMDGVLKLMNIIKLITNKQVIGIMEQLNKKQVTGRTLNQLNKKEIVLGVSQKIMKYKVLLMETNGQLTVEAKQTMTGQAVKQIMNGMEVLHKIGVVEEMSKTADRRGKKVHVLSVEKRGICHEIVQINNNNLEVLKNVLIVVKRDICLKSAHNQENQEKMAVEESQ